MAVTNRNWSKWKKRTFDRETASRSILHLLALDEDTLHSMAAVVYELGYMITDTELAHGQHVP